MQYVYSIYVISGAQSSSQTENGENSNSNVTIITLVAVVAVIIGAAVLLIVMALISALVYQSVKKS